MTMQEFRDECFKALGPPRRGQSQADQMRWYLKWKKGEAERLKREREHKADKLPEAEAEALLQNL